MLLTAPGHAVARVDNVLIQFRSAELTIPVARQMGTIARLFWAQRDKNKARGFLFVMAESAPPMSEEVRSEQQALVDRMSNDKDFWSAFVLEGEGMTLVAKRVAYRLLFSRRRELFENVHEGAAWLGERVGNPGLAFDLPEVVDELRRLAGVAG